MYEADVALQGDRDRILQRADGLDPGVKVRKCGEICVYEFVSRLDSRVDRKPVAGRRGLGRREVVG